MRILNIIALAYNLFLWITVYFTIADARVLIFFGVCWIFSILYQIMPIMRTFIIYVVLARLVSQLHLMILIVNVFMYIIASTPQDKEGLYLFIMLYTGPAAFHALTLSLLILFDYDIEKSQSSKFGRNQIQYLVLTPSANNTYNYQDKLNCL